MAADQISPLTLNRLLIYLRCLRSLQGSGNERISSQEFADRFNLSATQFRKDLTGVGAVGIRGIGYEVDRLTRQLEEFMLLDRTHPVVVVGVGNLGQALIRFMNATSGTYRVVAAVDNDPQKIGRTMIAGLAVEDSERIGEVVAREGAEIGVLTVPVDAAQKNYDALVAAGVRGVLNFAPTRLAVQPEVPVKSVDLRIFFEELGFTAGKNSDRTHRRSADPAG